MESVCSPERCDECSDRLVCRCLQITESTLVNAVTRLELRTLTEVRRCTGAGEGCTACHKLLKKYLAQSA